MKWVFATLGLLVVGLLLKLSLLVYAMYVLLGVLLLSRFFTRVWTEQIEARRFCDETVVEIGASAECKVAVVNTGRISVPWIILEDALSREAIVQTPPRLKADGARLMVTRLAAGATKVLEHRVKFLMRGYYQLGPLLAETGDVFGLHRRFRVLTEPCYVLVLPKVLPLEGYSLASRRPIGEIRLTHRLFEDPTRMSSIRPYQAGDPLNRIHWRATARVGQLQSRTFESSCVTGATFLLDFHAASFAGPAAVNSAELAIVTVASLANAVFLMGQQIGFISNGRDAADRIREEGWRAEFLTRADAQRRAANANPNTRLRPVVVKTGKGEECFTNILGALGRLEHTDGMDFSAMAAEAAAKISRDSTVVAVLGTVTPEMAAALGDLVRRGFLVTAVIVSFGMEAIPDWARPPEWAGMLLEQGIEFRIVSSEDSILNLCAEAICVDMNKPQPTVADYMVIALSPALIMALVGSLCFFLIDVFYRGQMQGGVRWVMFWFIVGIVLVSRIAIEKSSEHAAMYGLGLGAATWIYVARTHPSYSLIALALLAIVWFCAHKLVWDCTLIDEEQDSSGQGLLQKAPAAAPEKKEKGPKRKRTAPHTPGRWVVYFSLAALPLFGIGQKLLPGDESSARRNGLIFLAAYLAAALGLLVTTSFLGLRRYLRQRYLKMPPSIALAWLKFGAGVAVMVLLAAAFLPRPGANEMWAALRYQIDYRLQQASRYAAKSNPPGQGEGRAGEESGGREGSAPKSDQEQGQKPSGGEPKSGGPVNPSRGTPSASAPVAPAGNIYNLLKILFYIAVALMVATWIFRRRHLLLEMARGVIAAVKEFFRKLFGEARIRKDAGSSEGVAAAPQFNAFADYKNPFFAGKDYMWPPEQIILYSYEAVRVWAAEQGIAPRPEETAREFCARLGANRAELEFELSALSYLYAYAAYGKALPTGSDLEPIRELWRRLAMPARAVA